jgi:protein-S-isoprenylcysteine O-methyltransferase Ste14
MSLKTAWINLIYKTATGSRKARLILTPIVGLSYVLFAALYVILSFPTDRLFNFPRLLPSPANAIIAAPLVLIGVSLMIWSQLHFLKVKGTPVPFNPPPKLVTDGPYALSRNPMLSGIFILLFGLGAAFKSVSLVLIFTPLFILINVMELKKIEEPELEMRLGVEYLEYKQRTPMFFPKIPW